MGNKKILVAVNSFTESFESSLSGEVKNTNVVYIKTVDLND